MDFEILKKKVDDLRNKKERAKGALAQTMETLKETYGCDSLEDAKVLLSRLDDEANEAKTTFDKLMAEFQKEWGHVI